MKIGFSALAALLVTAGGLRAQTSVPAWQLEVARDSFVINIQGQPMGFTVLAVERAGDGYRVTETTRIGGMVEQDTEVMLDAQHRPTSVKQSGQAGGQQMNIEVKYAGSHVTGSASIPSPSGVQNHTIDMELPAGAVDDNLMQVVLARLPWSETTSYTIPMFSAGRNAVSEQTIKVVRTEKVTLPGGDVDAFKAEMQSGAQVINFWFSTAAPHRILKTAPVGAPLEIVRAN